MTARRRRVAVPKGTGDMTAERAETTVRNNRPARPVGPPVMEGGVIGTLDRCGAPSERTTRDVNT